MAIKTYKDLKFVPHNTMPMWKHAVMFFENGYGVSVVNDTHICDIDLAVLKGTAKKYNVCYTTSVTDGTISYLSPREVTKYMRAIQQLPKCN